jgi:hypothetical protein
MLNVTLASKGKPPEKKPRIDSTAVAGGSSLQAKKNSSMLEDDETNSAAVTRLVGHTAEVRESELLVTCSS